jgi:hypothetical protein
VEQQQQEREVMHKVLTFWTTTQLRHAFNMLR